MTRPIDSYMQHITQGLLSRHPARPCTLIVPRLVGQMHPQATRFFISHRLLKSSVSSSLTVGKFPLNCFGSDSIGIICHSATPIGFFISRRAYSTVR